MSDAAPTPPRTGRMAHAALSPLYLGLAVVLGALLTGISPGGALLAGAGAAGLSLPPLAVMFVGLRKNSRKIIRFALVVLILEVVSAGLLLSPGRSADFGILKLNAELTRTRLKQGGGPAYEATLKHAKAIADSGPRLTGSEGLSKVIDYVQAELGRAGWKELVTGKESSLAEAPPEKSVRRTEFSVLAPRDTGSQLVLGNGATRQVVRVHALMPNGIQACATPSEGLQAPLAYLGHGHNEDLEGRKVEGCIAVFEFASDDRWLWAYEHNAKAAVFLGGPESQNESVRQADTKYLALLPLHFPRVYVQDKEAEGAGLRTAAREGRSAVLHSRMELANVSAPVLEAHIRGTQSTREMLVMAHADARAIAPGLSYGGQDAFGVGAWLALFEHFAASPPAFSLRFVLFTGHWQQQGPERAYAFAVKDVVGEQIALSVGVALNPETDNLILTDETLSDAVHPSQYWWLKKLLFTVDRREPGWIDQIEDLSERREADRGGTPSKYAFYGGRPTLPGSNWSLWLAPVDQWPPLSHSIGFPVANEMMTQLGTVSVALATCGGYRQKHFTCSDTFEPWLTKTENLRPQLELSFALLGALADLDPARFPRFAAKPHRDYGGYNEAEVQVLRWNPSILWYDKQPPAGGRTFVMLAPTDGRFLPGRNHAYWPKPLAPNRHTHRLLQCLQTIYVAEADEKGRAKFQNVYCPSGRVIYNAIALTCDDRGRITHAFDQGFHGDMEFHFLERKFMGPRVLFQTPVFECGSLVLPSLVDADKFGINKQVEHEYRQQWGIGNDQDDGEVPWLPVRNVSDAGTHTNADSYSWMQQRGLAMVFLKPGQRCEIRAGDMLRKQALYNDDPLARAAQEKAGKQDLPQVLGFRLDAGEQRLLGRGALESYAQLARLTRQVGSPGTELEFAL